MKVMNHPVKIHNQIKFLNLLLEIVKSLKVATKKLRSA